MSYVDLDPLSAFTAVPSTWLAQLLANTEALHDGSGFASNASISSKFLNNPYKFSVKVGTSYSNSAGFLKIEYNSELFDTNNNFDSTTNYRYVAPLAGFYQFNSIVDSNSNAAGGTFYGSVIRRTTAIGAVETEYYGNGEVNTYASTFTHRCQASHLIQMAAGDYVEVIASLAAGTVGATSRFSGFLVSTT